MVSETWVRDDGWTVTVAQHDPLICSLVPMTVETLGAETITYSMLLSSLAANGYTLQPPAAAARAVAATHVVEQETDAWLLTDEGVAFTAYCIRLRTAFLEGIR